MHSKKPSNEIMRLARAFGHSFDGLRFGVTHSAFRIELLVACILLPMVFFLVHTSVERALLAGSIFLVLIVEMLNTGIEKAIDRISPDWHELSKIAKDVGSAAVLLSLANAGVIWLFILFS